MQHPSTAEPDTDPERTEPFALLGQRDSEPLPGYRLVELLGRGGFGEVWKCEAPGGLAKAIKLVRGNHRCLSGDSDQAEQEWQALQCLREVRHPFILSTERVELIDGKLIIVMELADQNLHDVLTACRARGLPGIPREELLDYLVEAAEALDLLNFQHGLQHLDIKPHNLFVVAGHVKVADFGLVNAFRDHPLRRSNVASGVIRLQKAGLTPLYASPELLQGRISPQCDQYSLAIVYQELLTGQLPFQGKNARQLLFAHLQAEPDLSPLPEEDRPIIARALAKNPEQRFPSCLDLIRSLMQRAEVISQEALPASSPSIRRTGRLRRTSCQLPSLSSRLAQPEDPEVTPGVVAPGHLVPGDKSPLLDTLSGANTDLSTYRFLDCLHRGPMGEVWSVQTPDGKRRMTHHLHSFALTNAAGQNEAFRLLRSLRSPILVPFEVLEQGPNRLVLLTDHFERSLRDRLQEARMAGREGIDRAELLGLLREVAVALDELAEQHRLYHLGLHPGNLFLHGDRVLVSGFGWLQMFWQQGSTPLYELNARYAAPELVDNHLSPTADQFSLALIYAELVSGRNPLKVLPPSARPGASGLRPRPGSTGGLDLTLLLRPEQDVLTQALARDPGRRFHSCTELFDTLLEALGEILPQRQGPRLLPKNGVASHVAGTAAERRAITGSERRPSGMSARPTGPLPATRSLIKQLVESLQGPGQVRDELGFRYHLSAGEQIQHHCGAALPAGGLEAALATFCKQHGAELLAHDSTSQTFLVKPARSLWHQLWSRQSGLLVQVVAQPPAKGKITRLTITLRPMGCQPEEATQLLEKQGPALLESLRSTLAALPEQRAEERYPWEQPVAVHAIGSAESPARGITGQIKDLSLSGLCLVLSQEPPTTQLQVVMPNPVHSAGDGRAEREVMAQVRLVRLRPLPGGYFEVGAVFVW